MHAPTSASRRWVLGALLSLVGQPWTALAQPTAKVYRVGVLGIQPLPEPEKAFADELRQVGSADRNITIVARYASAGSAPLAEQLRTAVEDLVAGNPDVIVTIATPAGLAASHATKTIPIVAVSTDPIKAGLVSSLARPGGNVTGVVVMGPELTAKRLELLTQAAPGVRRIYFPYRRGGTTDPVAGPVLAVYFREHQTAATALGLKFEPMPFEATFNPEEWGRVLAAIGRDRGSALSIHDSPVFIQHRTTIAELTLRHRVPAIFSFSEAVHAGGLMSYGSSLTHTVRGAALQVDKILNGARPAELPVEQPRQFELMVNLKAAKALGLTIPRSLLLRADQVIE
jgi:putative ABC transport system substrate-binding protein